MKNALRRTYNIVSFALVAAVVILAILLVGVRLVGLTPYTVLSGSMEPAYHVGSLIYVKEVDPMTFRVGDPITYRMGDRSVVTHRVIEVLDDPVSGSCYRTQGDANNIADGPLLQPENVIGKPVFTIPYLGYVSMFVQNPPGTYVAIAACLVLLSLSMLADVLFPKPEEKLPEAPQEAADESV